MNRICQKTLLKTINKFTYLLSSGVHAAIIAAWMPSLVKAYNQIAADEEVIPRKAITTGNLINELQIKKCSSTSVPV